MMGAGGGGCARNRSRVGSNSAEVEYADDGSLAAAGPTGHTAYGTGHTAQYTVAWCSLVAHAVLTGGEYKAKVSAGSGPTTAKVLLHTSCAAQEGNAAKVAGETASHSELLNSE